MPRTYDFDCQVELQGDELHRVILPVELTNGNDGRGSKWFSSAKVRKQLESLLIEHKRKPFAQPTVVELTRILGAGQRLWDADSIGRGNAKELFDSLVAIGWWHDDSHKYIQKVDYRQDSTRRSVGPAVEIVVRRWVDD